MTDICVFFVVISEEWSCWKNRVVVVILVDSRISTKLNKMASDSKSGRMDYYKNMGKDQEVRVI
jgi:hypothetical protein